MRRSSAALLQASPLGLAQRRDVRAGRTDAEFEGLPPFLEGLVLDLDDELGVLDGLDTCFPEQQREVTTACSRKGVLAGSLGIREQDEALPKSR